MSKPLILITGSSGLIGSQVLEQALREGYPVRIPLRPNRVEAMRSQYGDKVNIVEIPDLVGADYSEALEGVEAVIHIASPLPFGLGPEDILKGTLDGTLNLLRQATETGVKRFIVTGSWGATHVTHDSEQIFSDYVYTDEDWNPATREDIFKGDKDPLYIYCGAKALTERAIWEFAAEHPEIDVTVLIIPSIYGPLSRKGLTREDIKTTSTVGVFYQVVLPPRGSDAKLPFPQLPSPLTLDVRDAAKAHINALTAPRASEVGRKRLLLSAEQNFSFLDAVEHLEKVRPELRDRLPDKSLARRTKIATLDSRRAKKVLGINELFPWEKTVEDMTDNLLEIERSLD